MNKVVVFFNKDGLNVSELFFVWYDFIIKWFIINICVFKSIIEILNGVLLLI